MIMLLLCVTGMDAIDYQTDVNNCGSVGYKCTTSDINAVPTCTAGICGIQCISNYRQGKNGLCFDPYDKTTCGGNLQNSSVNCDNTSPYGTDGYSICDGEKCIYLCARGMTAVNGTCLSLLDDMNNCGSAGHVCPPSYDGCVGSVRCQSGLCQAASCQGRCQLASNITNGIDHQWCYDLANDLNNCLTIGNRCAQRRDT